MLRPDALTPLRVKLGHIAGPDSLGIPALPHYMGQFNPSIVAAPDGLCPRCAHLVSLRVDPLHQCHRQSPLFTTPAGLPRKVAATAWFRNTALAVLDTKFEVITWTWLLSTPNAQINPRWKHKNWTIDFGESDGFRPPWTGQVFDVRLFNLHGRIFATAMCAKCLFALMLVTITGDVTPDGGLVHLRAWRQTAQRFITWKSWAQGRNQAIFAARSTSAQNEQTVWHARGGGRLRSLHSSSASCGGLADCATVYVQPWLGLVATFGAPVFKTKRRLCMSRRVVRPKGDRTRGGDKNECGPTPLLDHLSLEVVDNPESSSLRKFNQRLSLHPRYTHIPGQRWPPSPPPPPPSPPLQPNTFGRLELLHNETAGMALKLQGHRLSTTTNLLHVTRRGEGGQRCGALLGVGHVHRREGDCTAQARLRCTCTSGCLGSGHPFVLSPAQVKACDMFTPHGGFRKPFRYGYQCESSCTRRPRHFNRRREYLTVVRPPADTHFFYTMEPQPPFRLIAASNEFCLASTQDPTDCESVQFVSGISLDPPEPQWRHQRAGGRRGRRQTFFGADADYLLEAHTLLLSFGINDCESKLARMRMDRVWSLLQPLDEGGSVCVRQ